MQKYNLYTFKNVKFLHITKEEIFQLFDKYWNNYSIKNISDYFSGDFNVRLNEGNFFVKKIILYKSSSFCEMGSLTEKKYFSKAAFKITDFYGYSIDLDKLFLDYKQSRNINSLQSKLYFNKLFNSYRRSTSKSRKILKKRKESDFKNSKSKQFLSSNEYVKEFSDYNIKTKRSQKNIINKYEDYFDYDFREKKSWKDKKVKKQWMKKKR